MIKEFIDSACPFLIVGLALAIVCVDFKKNTKQTYIIEGMFLGVYFGMTISLIYSFSLTISLALGMFLGESIGLFIEKKNE